MQQNDTALAEYLFHQGTNFHAYDFLGLHATPRPGGGYTYTARTWAPNAAAVSLCGDAWGWEGGIPLTRTSPGGIWEGTVTSETSLAGCHYKFRIVGADGTARLKGDPYAFYSEGGAGGASRLCHTSDFLFTDGGWMEHRRTRVGRRGENYLATPLSVYELHPGSFVRHEDGRPLSYRELGDYLAAYLPYMGYTHVELMGIAEHPFDGSWGYQVCAYYAPTSRYGTPDDFRYLVNRLHTAGVGVFMEWVPAHFPKDAWGLSDFDGRPLYEYQGHDRMESAGWGTRYFDVGREEVQCFLVSNALYWLREFHIDGLRVDAVAAMLYRDYDRPDGTWTPNSYGGRENLESIAFFRKLNTAVSAEFPDALMIAEESTAFPGITAPVEEGGLGFSLKWNMGFANDFFDYLSRDPLYRRYHHAALTFPMMYAYSEQYLLPVSHDEVVYGKRSFFSKIHGNREEKAETARVALLFIMTFPGKKMTFMGTEFGQEKEWDYRFGIDFHLLCDPLHLALRDYTAALSHFYLATPALWEADFTPDGFLWLLPDSADQNVVAYLRRGTGGGEVLVALSFSGVGQTLVLPTGGVWECVFSTAPWPPAAPVLYQAKPGPAGERLTLSLPPRAGVVLSRQSHKCHITV